MQANPYLLLGVIIGNALRTIVPWILSGQKWDWQYIGSAIWGGVLAFAGGTLILPLIDPAVPPLTAFLLGLFSAISLQTGARQVEKAVQKEESGE